jgi:undecaprenyl-diphosphatase
MTILQSIFLGIIEGVTEFLPISSTFHLIWATRLLGIPETEFTKLFNVFIQSGAIFAVVILYFLTILKDFKLALKLIVSFIPTAIIGLLAYDIIKQIFFESQYLIIGAFIFIGIIFIFVESFFNDRLSKNYKSVKDVTYKDAILIGFIQSAALMPGVSRAGAVLLGMLFLGYKRVDGAKYSFMLSIPTIFAASAFDLYESRYVIFSNTQNLDMLMLGFVSAFMTAFFSIKWLVSFLSQNSLKLFGWYRIIFGILLLLLALTGLV